MKFFLYGIKIRDTWLAFLMPSSKRLRNKQISGNPWCQEYTLWRVQGCPANVPVLLGRGHTSQHIGLMLPRVAMVRNLIETALTTQWLSTDLVPFLCNSQSCSKVEFIVFLFRVWSREAKSLAQDNTVAEGQRLLTLTLPYLQVSLCFSSLQMWLWIISVPCILSRLEIFQNVVFFPRWKSTVLYTLENMASASVDQELNLILCALKSDRLLNRSV